jgi:hypothetical protein
MTIREITPDFDPFDAAIANAPRKKSKFSIPHLNLDDPANLENVKFLLKRTIISAILIWFGATSTGSYYGVLASRYTGDLARVFYQWQLGTIIVCIGVCVIYDTYKHYY